ncbi:hypothetical protein K8I31_02655, partial [bacterium]|nr:hypothetical protein [bacterium]
DFISLICHKRSGKRTNLFSFFTDERKIHRHLGRKNFMYSDIQTLGRKRMYEHLKSNQLTEDQIMHQMAEHYQLSVNWWEKYRPQLRYHKVQQTITALDRAVRTFDVMLERKLFTQFDVDNLKNYILQITDSNELEKFKKYAKENNLDYDKLMK